MTMVSTDAGSGGLGTWVGAARRGRPWLNEFINEAASERATPHTTKSQAKTDRLN